MGHIKLNDVGDGVVILDQSLLPNIEEYIELKTPEEMHEAIRKLRVRGAPAIGIFAGYALAALSAQQAAHKSIRSCCGAAIVSDELFMKNLKEQGEYLKSSRPTAVNLAWAVDRIINTAAVEVQRARIEEPGNIVANAGAARLAAVIRREAEAIHKEDIEMCKSISRHGIEEIKKLMIERNGGETDSENTGEPFGILTHCNAGPLATSEYGTALGPILMGHEEGMKLRVFSDETRPLLQGARLTTYELNRAGVDVTLICDNMASMVMKNGWVQAVFVGCDRVAANGDVANKIGTSGVAVLAKYYGIPFYVLGPSSTIDADCPTGAEIPIEERNPREISEKYYKQPMAPEDVKCFNPAFDVTDHSLISGIITEKGTFRPPYKFE